MASKQVLLEIYMDGDTPAVRCVSSVATVDCEEVSVARGTKVKWKGADPGRLWTVVFLKPSGTNADKSPFAPPKRRIFTPDHDSAVIRADAPSDHPFDYCVSYEDPEGSMKHSDPRIMVRDDLEFDPNALVANTAELTAQKLDDVGAALADIAELYRALSDQLLGAGEDPDPGTQS